MIHPRKKARSAHPRELTSHIRCVGPANSSTLRLPTAASSHHRPRVGDLKSTTKSPNNGTWRSPLYSFSNIFLPLGTRERGGQVPRGGSVRRSAWTGFCGSSRRPNSGSSTVKGDEKVTVKLRPSRGGLVPSRFRPKRARQAATELYGTMHGSKVRTRLLGVRSRPLRFSHVRYAISALSTRSSDSASKK